MVRRGDKVGKSGMFDYLLCLPLHQTAVSWVLQFGRIDARMLMECGLVFSLDHVYNFIETSW
jgi:hypothetical protein